MNLKRLNYILFYHSYSYYAHIPIASSLSSPLSPPASTGHLNATTISSLHPLFTIHFLCVSFYCGRPPSDADRYFYYFSFSCVHLRNEFKTLWIPQFPHFSLSPTLTLLIYILLSTNLLFFLFLSFFISFFWHTLTLFSNNRNTGKANLQPADSRLMISLLKRKNKNATNHEHSFWFMAFWFALVRLNGHTNTDTSLPSNERSQHAFTCQPTLSWQFSTVDDQSLLPKCRIATCSRTSQSFRNFHFFLFLHLFYNLLFLSFVLYRPHTHTHTYTHAAIVVKFSKLATPFPFLHF